MNRIEMIEEIINRGTHRKVRDKSIWTLYPLKEGIRRIDNFGRDDFFSWDGYSDDGLLAMIDEKRQEELRDSVDGFIIQRRTS